LLERLAGQPGLQLHGTESADGRVGVVSVSVAGFEPQVLAALLDENFGIECRAGLHCAPGSHKCLGTVDGGGTVRLSVGPFTTVDEIDLAAAALCELATAG
jgi:selenocysteine lyase/cysteine desulfurase